MRTWCMLNIHMHAHNMFECTLKSNGNTLWIIQFLASLSPEFLPQLIPCY